ncbi:plasmid mobilization protein [Hyphococcus lacteus]|uniref:Ribbon-helix-helix protein, CopG family n=1 Tax=Hyphococcus lacteus TaxID=3143536 RepID=A0ABV3Z4P6_9PROT
MTASQNKKAARRDMITLRTTADEKNAIKARARAYGLSMGAFIREIALDKPLPKAARFTKSQGQFLALVLSSLAVMMDHLRKLEQSQPQADSTAGLASELLLLRDQCFTLMDHNP